MKGVKELYGICLQFQDSASELYTNPVPILNRIENILHIEPEFDNNLSIKHTDVKKPGTVTDLEDSIDKLIKKTTTDSIVVYKSLGLGKVYPHNLSKTDSESIVYGLLKYNLTLVKDFSDESGSACEKLVNSTASFIEKYKENLKNRRFTDTRHVSFDKEITQFMDDYATLLRHKGKVSKMSAEHNYINFVLMSSMVSVLENIEYDKYNSQEFLGSGLLNLFEENPKLRDKILVYDTTMKKWQN